MILPEVRDPRLVTIRRGGTLTDAHHRLLALWAVTCAERVVHHFDAARPDDPRPREAIESARGWVRGEVPMMTARAVGGHAMGAARDLVGAVAEHDLGAAAYAIKAAGAADPGLGEDRARRRECSWQREQLPPEIRTLVIEDQHRRNDICWSVFEC